MNARIEEKKITAIMGPSGCGKSTLLRAINRMHELYPDIRITGEILLNGKNILKTNPMEVRRMAGMVFQRPNPFPTMSIYDNVIAGYKLNGIVYLVKKKIRSSNKACKMSDYGKRSKTLSIKKEPSFPADSNNACVSPGRWL